MTGDDLRPHLERLRFDDLPEGQYRPEPKRPLQPKLMTAARSARRPTAEPESLGSTSFDSGSDALAAKYSATAESVAVPAAKPHDDIAVLEQLLSGAYGSPALVTRIRRISASRKEAVKEVHFSVNDRLAKVWIFKADPVNTARELAIYHIAHEAGVPTGRPIGYSPATAPDEYPFDIGILGGVVEHAGEPYASLLANMELQPQLMHHAAMGVARMLADVHARLTASRERFERLGIELERVSPERELTARLYPALGIAPSQAKDLTAACEALYRAQRSAPVISHGDIHTGNVVTASGNDFLLRQPASDLSRFGVIDWGSIGTDTAYGDLEDFWIHHRRIATAACGEYRFGFEDLLDAYRTRFGELATELGLGITCLADKRDARIQSALWNLYEMHDPTREGAADRDAKAALHRRSLFVDLDQLADLGCRRQVGRITAAMHRLAI